MGLSASLFRAVLKGHVWLYRRSGGRIGSMKGTILLLTTTGRKSGREWTVPLMGLAHGDGFLVAASAGGDPKHPAWYLNLQHHPEVVVERDGATIPMTSRTATEEERPALWARFPAANKGFAKYEQRTTREIPVVILEPRS
jgi:deazaflavin-dependent oxidoreductase (nitroreductase family)